jgi:transposase
MGVIERGGRVVAEPAARDKVTGKALAKFLSKFVDMEGSLLITDELPAYHRMGKLMNHVRINHSIRYVDGHIHTNSIEGFWALVKRAWYGSHHHYSRKYLHLYIAEACYKFNARNQENSFGFALAAMVGA